MIIVLSIIQFNKAPNLNKKKYKHISWAAVQKHKIER